MLVDAPTELATTATDGLLALESLGLAAWLGRAPMGGAWRSRLWRGAFALLAVASLLGAATHGLALPTDFQALVWPVLYLALGVMVALFLVGAVLDGWGPASARRLLPWALAGGAACVAATGMLGGAFRVFLVFEGGAMLAALAVYVRLAARQRLPGAGLITLSILVNLIAAGIQAGGVSPRALLPLDHNGLFHLVQMIGVTLLAAGLTRNKASPPATSSTTPA